MTTTAPDSTRAVPRPDLEPPRTSALGTFAAMLAREVHVLRRQFITFILRTIMQPLLFVFVFSFILPSIGAGPLAGGTRAGASFTTILVPGMVAMSIMMSGMMSVLFPLIMELSYTKEITDRLLAPLPTWALAVEKIVAGAIQAMIAGLCVFPIVALLHAPGHAPDIAVDNWGVLVAVLVLGSLLAPAMGLFLGTIVDPQKTNQLFGFILMPAAMLGCVYYPWAALDAIPWLQDLVLVNPIIYMSEGLRTTLTPAVPHMSLWAIVPVLVLSTGFFTGLSIWSFKRRVLD